MTPALLGTARLANFRLGYVPAAMVAARAATVGITMAGADVRTRIRLGSLTITDALNDAPNTASFRCEAPAPVGGQAFRVTLGVDAPRLLFNGTIETVDLTYEGRPTELIYSVKATDDLARLNQRLPFGAWDSVSASTIAASLLASFATGITGTNIQAGLPAISVVFDGSQSFAACLAEIATLMGGYFYLEDLDLHLFTSEASDLPAPIDASHPFLNEPPIASSIDLSQLRTRVYGKGHGEATIADVAAGETILPVAKSVLFAAGSKAIVGAQRITYTGVSGDDLPGSTIGLAAVPSVVPNVALQIGGALGTGVYQYAYLYVTAAGKSLGSPQAVITTRVVGTPPAPAVINNSGFLYPGGGDLPVGASVQYAYSYGCGASAADFTKETARSPATTVTVIGMPGSPSQAQSPRVTTTGGGQTAPVGWVHWWRNVNGAGWLTFINNATGGDYSIVSPTFNMSAADFGNAGHATVTANATFVAVDVSGIGVGPAGTTQRELYRTAVNGSQLKLRTIIFDNTTTTYADILADASLGGNIPTTDTSGLVTAQGQVNAGSTSILTANPGPFNAGGGWAILANQEIRYTGRTVDSLTGVPASGPGALVNTAKYGEHIDPAPALNAVVGLTAAVPKGETVSIWTERNDVPAQTAAAAREGGGASGIHEHLFTDTTDGFTALIAACDAELLLFSQPIVTVTYATRDTKTKSGKPVTVNLTTPPIAQMLTIQQVEISELGIAAGLLPKFTATASSVRFSLPDLLRRALETKKGKRGF